MTETPIQQIKALLQTIKLPSRDIKCYGDNIMITTAGESTARKWAAFIAQFATVRVVKKTLDEVRDEPNSSVRYVKAYLVWATI